MTASDAVPAVPEPTELTSLPVYDHWETRAICNDVDGTHIEKYYPKQAPGDSTSTPIQFSIKGNSDHIDLNHSFLLISGQFEGKVPKKTADGTLVALGHTTASDFFFANFLPHALIESVNVDLANRGVNVNDQHYALRAYIQTLLSAPKEYATGFLRATQGWLKDEGTWDGFDPANNSALQRRKDLFVNDKNECFFIIDLHSPFMQLEKTIISELDIDISITRQQNPKYYIMADNAADVQFKIKQAVLHVRKVTFKPHVSLAIERKMASGVTYVMDDPRFIIQSIPVGETYVIKDNITNGHMPKRIIVTMMETTAFNGQNSKNPFRFDHFNATSIGLTKNGVEYPIPPIPLDFKNKNIVELIRYNYASLQANKTGPGPDLTPKDLMDGAFFVSWDMSPDQYGIDNPEMIINRNTNIKLQINFAEALKVNVTLVVFYMLEQRATINKERQVISERVA